MPSADWARLPRRASKKKKGSANRKKANQKTARLHERIANQRKDFIHKASDAITKQYDTIVLEDLAVSNMGKNHKLARSISDAGWGMFRQLVEYKADWRGKNVLTIGRFEPSSKLHNTCGHINEDLLLSDREWVCPNCNELVLRDWNAAINILNFGLLRACLDSAFGANEAKFHSERIEMREHSLSYVTEER